MRPTPANPLIFPLNASCMLKHAQAETSKTNSKAYAPLHTLEKKSETPSFWNLPLRCSYSCLTLPYKIRVWIPLIQHPWHEWWKWEGHPLKQIAALAAKVLSRTKRSTMSRAWTSKMIKVLTFTTECLVSHWIGGTLWRNASKPISKCNATSI